MKNAKILGLMLTAFALIGIGLAGAQSSTTIVYGGSNPVVSLGLTDPVALSATITSTNTAKVTTDIGSISGTTGTATLYTHGSIGMDILNVSPSITTNIGTPLAFSLTSMSGGVTQALLDTYFAGKVGSPLGTESGAMYNQLASEVAGTAPFFYLTTTTVNGVAVPGVYGLEDGFYASVAGGSSSQKLQINDDYPVGTYTYTGTVGSQAVTVTLTVVQANCGISTSASSLDLSSGIGSITVTNEGSVNAGVSISGLPWTETSPATTGSFVVGQTLWGLTSPPGIALTGSSFPAIPSLAPGTPNAQSIYFSATPTTSAPAGTYTQTITLSSSC